MFFKKKSICLIVLQKKLIVELLFHVILMAPKNKSKTSLPWNVFMKPAISILHPNYTRGVSGDLK